MRFTIALASLVSLAVATPTNHGSNANVDVKADVKADVVLAAVANVDVDASVAIDAKVSGFTCPGEMKYCHWTKACACPPGQSWDMDKKSCHGDKMHGAWPKPDVSVYAHVGVELGAFCAISPYKIAKYDPGHKYCQAGIDTVTFCASVEIEAEIEKMGHRAGAGAGAGVEVEIDVEAEISADLHNVCAGLSGLYLESAVDAALLFNTNQYGLATVYADVIVSADVSVSVLKTVKSVTCLVGLGNCHYDCVSYCTKGCRNYVDVSGEIGARLTGLAGFCIMPNVIVMTNSVKVVVSIAIESMLCVIGRMMKSVTSLYNCNCN